MASVKRAPSTGDGHEPHAKKQRVSMESMWGHNSRALYDRGIIHGVDGSILSDGDLVYVVADEHPVECRILRIDYFHGHDPVMGPVAQMMDEEESDIYACEMFSLQRPSRIVRAMTWLQRIWRQRRRRGVTAANGGSTGSDAVRVKFTGSRKRSRKP